MLITIITIICSVVFWEVFKFIYINFFTKKSLNEVDIFMKTLYDETEKRNVIWKTKNRVSGYDPYIYTTMFDGKNIMCEIKFQEGYGEPFFYKSDIHGYESIHPYNGICTNKTFLASDVKMGKLIMKCEKINEEEKLYNEALSFITKIGDK